MADRVAGRVGRPARAGHVVRRPRPPTPDGTVGYRGPTACSAAGITYRQLDYWARTGLVAPSVRSAAGSGSQRLYSFKDILVLKVVKRLLDTGVSLQNIRTAVEHLRAAAWTTWPGSPCCPTAPRCTNAPRRRRSSTCCAAGRACSASRSAERLARAGRLAGPSAERARRRRADARHCGASGRFGHARRAGPAASAAFGRRLTRLAAVDWHCQRGRLTLRGRADRPGTGTPKGQLPRNLSGTRTARDEALWSRRPDSPPTGSRSR